MRVAVVGAGAMGSLFAAYLAEGGHPVVLVDPWREHVRVVSDRGLLLEDGLSRRRVALKAVTSSRGLEAQDLVLVFVKAYDTAKAASEMGPLLGLGTVVLTLQNGLGNVRTLADIVGESRVLAGTTAHGATVLGAGHIRHAGKGETVIGRPRGETLGLRRPDRHPPDRGAASPSTGGNLANGRDGDQPVRMIAAAFNRSGLQTTIAADIEGVIWGKLLVNAAVNPLSALLGLPTGALLDTEGVPELMELLLAEGAAVAARKGIPLPYPDPLEKVRAVAAATAMNRSSMLQDIERGRPTEVDFINGAIAAEAAAEGVLAPANRIMTLLIKALEHSAATRRPWERSTVRAPAARWWRSRQGSKWRPAGSRPTHHVTGTGGQRHAWKGIRSEQGERPFCRH